MIAARRFTALTPMRKDDYDQQFDDALRGPAAAARPHPPARRARREPLVELAAHTSTNFPHYRLSALACDRAQPSAHALAALARTARAGGARSGISRAVRRGGRRSRQRVRV